MVVARIPGEGDFDRIHTRADQLAREWAADSQYAGCTLLMLIKAADVEIFSAMRCRSGRRGAIQTIELPRPIGTKTGWHTDTEHGEIWDFGTGHSA